MAVLVATSEIGKFGLDIANMGEQPICWSRCDPSLHRLSMRGMSLPWIHRHGTVNGVAHKRRLSIMLLRGRIFFGLVGWISLR